MAALRKLAAAATTSALLAPRARAAEAPAADEEQAAELRAKVLALAAAQRERTDWEARRLHQLMRAVDEDHSRERAATLEKAAAEDAKAFAEERARKAEQRAKSDEAAAVRERAEARADVRRLLTEYDDALALVLETARGAGEMAEQSGETMDSLIARVRSPGGTTAAAFDFLDGTDFRAIFSAAVVAARDRAIDLADQAHEQGKDQ